MQFLPGGAIKVAGAHLQIASNLLKPKNIQNLILDTLERYIFFSSFDTIFVFFLVTIRYFGLKKDLLSPFFWVRKWALLAKSDLKNGTSRSWLLVELERPPPPASQILWDE